MKRCRPARLHSMQAPHEQRQINHDVDIDVAAKMEILGYKCECHGVTKKLKFSKITLPKPEVRTRLPHPRVLYQRGSSLHLPCLVLYPH